MSSRNIAKLNLVMRQLSNSSTMVLVRGRNKTVLFSAFVLLIVLVGLILTALPLPLSAQSSLRWSIARRVPGYADESSAPVLVADNNLTVHAFGSQFIGAEYAIFYNRWTPKEGWSEPIDVILSPKAQRAEIMSAFLDSRGMMHVIFFGGNNTGGELYYTRAPAINAGQAPAWSTPVSLDPSASNPSSGIITGDDKGNLYAVYSGTAEGNGIYVVVSRDGGETWSAPLKGFLTNSTSLWAFGIQAALDAHGQLHAVWTVVNKAGNGESVYYARFESDKREWGLPITLQDTKGNDYEADWATIIPYNDELFVIYNYGFPPFRWMRRSSDGGSTWSPPTKAIPTLKGENGHPVLAVDGGNNLHMILANRTLDDVTHGLWHSVWQDDHWTEPEAIIAGPASSKFDPAWPKAVIVQGNKFLTLWRQDPGLIGNGVWYSFAELDARPLPLVPLPTVTLAPTVISTPLPQQVIEPTRTPIAVPAANFDSKLPVETAAQMDPNLVLLLAVLPVVLLIGLLLLVRGVRRAY